MGSGNGRDSDMFVCARPRFNCVKKLNAAGQCVATSAQRTVISRLFQFAAHQKKSRVARVGQASSLDERLNKK